MAITLETTLCSMLGIEHPIIQAGMAGGFTTPELVAAVSNAGGLGTLGAAYMKPDEIRLAIRKIKEQTSRPFAVNLFVCDWTDTDDAEHIGRVQAMLDGLRVELGMNNMGNRQLATADLFAEQFQVILEEEVPIISTAFGVLPAEQMTQNKRTGQKVLTMVTTVEEAIHAERHGSDMIVAQGSEAGGHRGTFDMKKHPYGASIGTFALVPQVVDAVKIPVVATGGLMDGRGLVAALALGAVGVQLGTRFLTASEAGTQKVHQEALLRSIETDMVITTAFSGRPARGIRNHFINYVEQSGIEVLPFPTQNTATSDIRKEAATQQKSDYLSLWSGQGVRLITADTPAKDIVASIVKQAEMIIG